MKKIIFLLLFGTVTAFAQTQIDADINGEAANDSSGYSVSLSQDGSVVAIGAIYNAGNSTDSGHVRVYKNVSNVWTQVGGDINGEAANDLSGLSVSLSQDGSVVAIGAPNNTGNGTNSGHVRVYKNVANVWTQVGADINGEAANDGSGYSVSLSQDGSVVAIGATCNDGNGSCSGHVRVYKNVSNVWTQVGADINGDVVDEYSGYSVSLSQDGGVVAIGAIYYDGNGTDSGRVRVYKNVANVWTQVGADINGEAASDYCGYSVSLSQDGSVVAIGAIGNGTDSGRVWVYKNVSNVWTQVGADINGEAANDFSGHSVSLSSDGGVVAIGAYSNDGNGLNSGHVRVYNLAAVLASDGFVNDDFSILPNPTSDILNINLGNNLTLIKVNIYTTLGQLIKIENKSQINISGLAKGNYFVEVITNQGRATKTIIIE